MTEPQQDHETRQKFRKIYNKADASGSALQRDRYAAFMAERFPEADDGYALTWAERFKHGRHIHKMDAESKLTFLKVLCTAYDGTAAELRYKDLAAALEKYSQDYRVKDACPACDLEVTEYQPTESGLCPMCGREVSE
ncbi:MAG: hypothetical protein SVV03_02490 [Candidatus Nanohaloarchaea archaeon]|nr:hypothetical protein [Candidatus Nanohaloarchaea archaeon]